MKSQIEILNTVFKNCKASSGGAFLVNLLPEEQINFSVKNLVFEDNTADIGSAGRILGG